jgi:hypothetical protein
VSPPRGSAANPANGFLVAKPGPRRSHQTRIRRRGDVPRNQGLRDPPTAARCSHARARHSPPRFRNTRSTGAARRAHHGSVENSATLNGRKPSTGPSPKAPSAPPAPHAPTRAAAQYRYPTADIFPAGRTSVHLLLRRGLSSFDQRGSRSAGRAVLCGRHARTAGADRSGPRASLTDPPDLVSTVSAGQRAGAHARLMRTQRPVR